MKNPLFLSSIAVALGVAAVVISLTGRRPVASYDTSGETTESRDGRSAEAHRIEALTQRIRDLNERLSALELVPVAPPSSRSPGASTFVSREEFDSLRREVLKALSGRGTAASKGDSASDEFRDQVAATLSEIRKAEAVRNVRAKQESQIERLNERMPKIEGWLELTPDQSTRMRSALLAQYDRDAELTRRWEEGESDEVLGEIKRTNRETHLTELGQILTPAQLETYSLRGGKGN